MRQYYTKFAFTKDSLGFNGPYFDVQFPQPPKPPAPTPKAPEKTNWILISIIVGSGIILVVIFSVVLIRMKQRRLKAELSQYDEAILNPAFNKLDE